MSKGKVPFIIRLMDRDGDYVGLVPLPRAESMATLGKLTITYNGRRTFAQALVSIEDFDSTKMDRPIYHMAESHQGHCLVVVKRLCKEKSYGMRWDPGLTFEELRQGRMISHETERIQDAARQNRIKREAEKAAA
jgi:hypothetical protein